MTTQIKPSDNNEGSSKSKVINATNSFIFYSNWTNWVLDVCVYLKMRCECHWVWRAHQVNRYLNKSILLIKNQTVNKNGIGIFDWFGKRWFYIS